MGLREIEDASVVGLTPAHQQRLTLHLLEFFPEHEPREHDAHYAAFNAMKRRAKAAGLDKCVVCGKVPVEWHHTLVEFAFQNGVDVAKLDTAFGLHLTEEEFADWVESPGNAEPLCVAHHRGAEAVHSLPEPIWNAVRTWRDDLPPPVQVLRGE